jgi:hypothetical protein
MMVLSKRLDFSSLSCLKHKPVCLTHQVYIISIPIAHMWQGQYCLLKKNMSGLMSMTQMPAVKHRIKIGHAMEYNSPGGLLLT